MPFAPLLRLARYHPPPPPPPPDDPLLPELDPGAVDEEDIALEKALPIDVANIEAVEAFQLGPEYQSGE